MLTRSLTILAACAALAAVAAPAQAAKGQLSIFQDDLRVRGSGNETRAKTLDELDRLGVDVVKVLVMWRYVAPAGESKPNGFDGSNPAAYTADAWAPYDDIVRQARARGMRVLFALGGKAPDWASSGTKRSPGTKRPNPGEFHKFVRAVGTRYSGSYVIGGGSGGGGGGTPPPPDDPDLPLPLPAQATPAQSGTRLPRVNLWAVWNEPNLAPWLSPQRVKRVPFAPHHYRRLVYGAHSALRATGHGKDTMLIGELAPYGSSKNRLRPLHFLREMACVNKKYRPFRGKAARKRGCRKFRRVPGSGLAIHPYTLAGGPGVRMKNRDDVTISYLGRLAKTLNRLGGKRRLAKRRMPIWVTEFAFQTDPPDIFQTPIKKVPGFMGWSEWLSYRNGRVRSHAQFLLRDEEMSGGGFARYGGFQTGIRFANGKAKKGVYKAYRLPFFVKARGSRKVEIWGGVRTAGKGGRVTVQVRKGKRWRNLGKLRTAKRGYFRKTFRLAGARKHRYRFRSGKLTSVTLGARR